MEADKLRSVDECNLFDDSADLQDSFGLARVAEGKDDGLNQGPGLPAKEQGFHTTLRPDPLIGETSRCWG